jgi:hypothetical protein
VATETGVRALTESSYVKASTVRLQPLEDAQEHVPSRFGTMSKTSVVKMLQAERGHVERLRKHDRDSRV